jgi:single-strand binding protein
MASGDVNITVVGNVVADPELRFTSTGAAVATFRVASTPRRYDSQSGQWVDGEALFLTCNVWRQVAENIAETLTKGMRVIVTGRLRSRSYDTQNGDRRTVMELEVDEVGPSLRYATAQVTRNPRGEGGGNYGGGFGGNQGGGMRQQQQSAPQQQQQMQPQYSQPPQQQQSQQQPQQRSSQQQQQPPANDPWSSAPPANGGFGGADDEPPF